MPLKPDLSEKILTRLDSIESKMVLRDEFDRRLDSVESKMVTRDEFHSSVDKMVTRDEFDQRFTSLESKMVTRDEYLSRADEILVIVQRLDQERMFTTEWIRRIETDVDRIKKQLHLV